MVEKKENNTLDQLDSWSFQFRAIQPLETLKKISSFFSIMGITRIANITHLDVLGVPVFQCFRPNSKTLSVSQGKGLTSLAAKVSAAMEAIESWHAEQPQSLSRFNSIEELDANEIKFISLHNLRKHNANALEVTRQFHWLQAHNLYDHNPIWVPAEFVSLDRTPNYIEHAGCFRRNSIGLASGNTLDEAILHGLLEVIERHSYALWLARSSEPIDYAQWIAIDSIDVSVPKYVLEKIQDTGASVYLEEITTDLGIPCYQCLILGSESLPIGPAYSWGMSCHVDKETALIGAITEAAQTRLTMIAGSRDDLTYEHFEHFYDFRQLSNFRERIDKATFVKFELSQPQRFTSTQAALSHVVGKLREREYKEICVVDLTADDIAIPVVKVIVPQMKYPLM